MKKLTAIFLALALFAAAALAENADEAARDAVFAQREAIRTQYGVRFADYGDVLDAYRALISGDDPVEALLEAELCELPGYAESEKTGCGLMELNSLKGSALYLCALTAAPDDFDYGLLYDLYASQPSADGLPLPHRLLMSTARDRYYLLADGQILNESSSSAMESGWVLYEVKDGALSRLQALEYDGSEDADALWSFFDGSQWQAVSEEEALKWIEAAENRRVHPAAQTLDSEPANPLNSEQ